MKTTKQWIDEHINKLNSYRAEYLRDAHNLESAFEYFSYSKDMTGYKLTSNNFGTEIGKRMNEEEFEAFLETTTDVIKELFRK